MTELLTANWLCEDVHDNYQIDTPTSQLHVDNVCDQNLVGLCDFQRLHTIRVTGDFVLAVCDSPFAYLQQSHFAHKMMYS
ncbi:MAG: hypothetical protein AAFQ07_14060 [Chloroflexota bacterium]